MVPNVANTLLESLNQGLFTAVAFLPNLIAGIIIIIIGVIFASLMKRVLLEIFNALKINAYLKKYEISDSSKGFGWANILSEIFQWFILVLFLIPAAEVWKLPQVAVILNTFLLYLPNVFVAAIIGFVGLVGAKLASEVVSASTRKLKPDVSRTISSGTRITITVFVLLAVLNQLGVAQDLIKILFTGFVAMIALAGGLAFGLGGKDFAKSLLEALQSKLKQ